VIGRRRMWTKFTAKYRYLCENRCDVAETSSGDADVRGSARGTSDAYVSNAHRRREREQLAPNARHRPRERDTTRNERSSPPG